MGRLRTEDAEAVAARFEPERMYTVPEVADLVGVNASLVYRAATVDGELGYVRLRPREGIRIPGRVARGWVRSRWGVSAVRGREASRSRNTTPINGEKVRSYRERRDLSLKDLAAASQVGKSTIGRIEQQGRQAGCRIDNARALAKALRVKPRTLGVKEEAYG